MHSRTLTHSFKNRLMSSMWKPRDWNKMPKFQDPRKKRVWCPVSWQWLQHKSHPVRTKSLRTFFQFGPCFWEKNVFKETDQLWQNTSRNFQSICVTPDSSQFKHLWFPFLNQTHLVILRNSPNQSTTSSRLKSLWLPHAISQPVSFSTGFFRSMLLATHPACLFCVSGCMYDTLSQSGMIKGTLDEHHMFVSTLIETKQHTLQALHRIIKLKALLNKKHWQFSPPCFIVVSSPLILLECHWRPSKKAASALECLCCVDLCVCVCANKPGKNLKKMTSSKSRCIKKSISHTTVVFTWRHCNMAGRMAKVASTDTTKNCRGFPATGWLKICAM